jgi:hypothetical protein
MRYMQGKAPDLTLCGCAFLQVNFGDKHETDFVWTRADKPAGRILLAFGSASGERPEGLCAAFTPFRSPTN